MQIFSRHCTATRHTAGSLNSDHRHRIPCRPINSSWNYKTTDTPPVHYHHDDHHHQHRWPHNAMIDIRGHPKSFRPRHIRQQYFLQSLHQWNVHPLRTLMSRLRMWRHCNLWRHRALNRTDFQRPQKRSESFIIMDSGHHHYQISDFKTDNSHWR